MSELRPPGKRGLKRVSETEPSLSESANLKNGKLVSSLLAQDPDRSPRPDETREQRVDRLVRNRLKELGEPEVSHGEKKESARQRLLRLDRFLKAQEEQEEVTRGRPPLKEQTGSRKRGWTWTRNTQSTGFFADGEDDRQPAALARAPFSPVR